MLDSAPSPKESSSLSVKKSYGDKELGGSQLTGIGGSEQLYYWSFEDGVSMQGFFSNDDSGCCHMPVCLGSNKSTRRSETLY